MVLMKCKSSLIWLILFFLFLESASVGVVLNIPLATALHSYDGLISHFLGRLGRHRALGGVRPFHVGHEQAHFLIGPPPLRVQLTVIPKRHLRLGGRRVGGGKTGGGQTSIQLILRYLRQSSTDVGRERYAGWSCCKTGAHKPRAKGLILNCHFPNDSFAED